MRLIRLKLRYSMPFWILKPIALRRGEQEISPLINIDILTDNQKAIINRSISNNEVYAYDAHDNLVIDLYNVNLYQGDHVSVEDDDDDNVYPEIIAVTIDETKKQEIPKEVNNDVEVLLSKNGNTIKKLISVMDLSQYNKDLLEVSLRTERTSKNRQGVINYIKKKLMEF